MRWTPVVQDGRGVGAEPGEWREGRTLECGERGWALVGWAVSPQTLVLSGTWDVALLGSRVLADS